MGNNIKKEDSESMSTVTVLTELSLERASNLDEVSDILDNASVSVAENLLSRSKKVENQNIGIAVEDTAEVAVRDADHIVEIQEHEISSSELTSTANLLLLNLKSESASSNINDIMKVNNLKSRRVSRSAFASPLEKMRPYDHLFSTFSLIALGQTTLLYTRGWNGCFSCSLRATEDLEVQPTRLLSGCLAHHLKELIQRMILWDAGPGFKHSSSTGVRKTIGKLFWACTPHY